MYGGPIGTHQVTNALSDSTIGTKAHKMLGKVVVGVVRES